MSNKIEVARNHHRRTHMLPDRYTIVHLFEWKWKDIAQECEDFLFDKGYGAVQISPPSEYLVLNKDGQQPWYERYQVMSYNLITRSGDENDLLEMTRRCNKLGIRIYADIVLNHMTGDGAGTEGIGSGGSVADIKNYYYPAVPYTREHFHRSCKMENFNDVHELRNCELSGLLDLDQSNKYVRDRMVDFLNHLVRLGIAGFRIDAAKHMSPKDILDIFNRVDDLNVEFGFAPGSRPYVYQEVIYYGEKAAVVKPEEYFEIGDVTEFRVGHELKRSFTGENALKWLVSWGEAWGLMASDHAVAFIDNHDTQRYDDVLTYKKPRPYRAATGFMLAHPYGQTRVMSSYFFDNIYEGPPADQNQHILTPAIGKDGTFAEGRVSEHRWRQIYQMVIFRNVVRDTEINNWWDNGNNQIAFSRGNKGFVAFNLESYDFDQYLQTGLPPGTYCDVISGKRRGNTCTGTKVHVDHDGRARIQISRFAEDFHLAIHVGPESNLSIPDKKKPFEFEPHKA